MPLYEYGCPKCGKTMEIVQKFSDPVLTQCPECGNPGLEKLISQTSFTLKGGGWYATDYKKSGATSPSPAKPAASESASSTPPSTTPASTATACGAGACAPKKDGGGT